MKIMKGILLLCMVALFSGCASTRSMSPHDRLAINTLYVNNNVTLPEKMLYWDRTSSMAVGIAAGLGAAAGGGKSAYRQGAYTGTGVAVGFAVGELLAQGPSQTIVQRMKESGISVGDIVRHELMAAMRANAKMDMAESPESADAVMTVKVNVYGFNQTQGFSSLLYPTLNVSVSIADHTGREVWKQHDFITPLNKRNTVAHTFEEYVGNPALLKEAFTEASKVVAEWLVEKIPARPLSMKN